MFGICFGGEWAWVQVLPPNGETSVNIYVESPLGDLELTVFKMAIKTFGQNMDFN